MSEEDKEQLKILKEYIYKKELLDDIWYVECEDCSTVFKVYTKAAMHRRRFCDKCRLIRNRPRVKKHNKSNEDIGWRKYQHYNKK